MIAVDSSALLAIALKEPERQSSAGSSAIIDVSSAPLRYSRAIWLCGIAQVRRAMSCFRAPNFDIIDFDRKLLSLARIAFDRYGKAHHRRGLNFGDCMSYALAKLHDVPLLYEGEDFALTDIRSAAP